MRRPSTSAHLYAWHRAAVAGLRPDTYETEIQCGWFRTRMVKNGPWVPGRIWIERQIDMATGELTCDETFRAEINGERWSAHAAWGRLCGNPISKEAYDRLVATQRAMPEMAATHASINLSTKAMRP